MKIRRIFLVLLVFFAAGSTYADSWSKTYGASGNDNGSVRPTTGAGYLTFGYSDSFGNGGDAWLVKLNSAGTVSWQKRYGGNNYEQANSVLQTSDGGYLVSAHTLSYGAGSYDAWLLKLNSAGNIQWQKTYGGPLADIGGTLIQTSDGGYVMTGLTDSFSVGGSDAWIMKLDPAGAILWQKSFGGSNYDTFHQVQQTTDGGFIVVGSTYSFGNPREAWILKLNPTGNIIWQKKYGGSGDDVLASIQQTPDGGYIASGFTTSYGAGFMDYWIVKLDGSGNISWQKTYGGVEDDMGIKILHTPVDGGYIFTGGTQSFGAGISDGWILKLSSAGAILWQKTYGGVAHESIGTIHYLSNEQRYIAGGATASFGAGDNDQWVLKLSTNGEISQGCGLVANTSVVPGSSFATAVNTNVLPRITNARVTDTSAIALNTNATAATQCIAP